MSKTTHPVAIAVHLEDAFNRRDLPSILPFVHRTVEISKPDGTTSVGHDAIRRLLEEADSMGTGRYVTWAHYVNDDGIVSGAIRVELCESTNGETLSESEFVVTLDCVRGKVRVVEARETDGEEEVEAASGDEEDEAASSHEEAEVAS